MRCSSSALVLATLAIGQAAADTISGHTAPAAASTIIRHAKFYARRNAEAQGTNEAYVFSFLSTLPNPT